ncbi:C39 family peptidase [Alisedimentitalea sp. MJ-SS2]|uniref:C39 family peptidase n=1 Tax=Aliisedimentitalea sp. MJ-SS2 TaxID=3049795 RepID=UPI00290771CA|nr:C39 family peptidase [Alisedimentitalea sp. MJ-SS2]MDU8927798.1 C39 family peptidase [Alisedimentitalea sp. MJ-SS2]
MPVNTHLAIIAAFVVLTTAARAEIGWNNGAIAHRKLPPPEISRSFVRLDVPHMRQGRDLCVPTSAAMILRYFGEKHDPRALKALAENHKPIAQRNSFTYWRDMDHALRQIGHRWKIRDFARTDAGFNQGLNALRKHLRQGLPAMIDVHQDEGHTFVVMGFDDTRQVVFVRDPNLPKSRSRILSYAQLKDSWHNHRFGPHRSAFFAYK